MKPFVARVARRVPYARRALDWLAPERSAAALTRRNTLQAYDTVYDSEHLLEEYLSPDRRAFYEELATILARLAPRRVLDVGCGTGHLLRFLIDRMETHPERIVGIDHSEAGIRRARALLPSGIWVVGDLYNLSTDLGPFDLVLCTEVLEHLHEPSRAVERLRERCAPPAGCVAITVPDGAHDSWEGHVNFWSEQELEAFLAPHGLVAIDRLRDGDLLAWLKPEST